MDTSDSNIMNKNDKDSRDKGVILVLLERFNKQRLPRAKAMEKKVDAGELLNDHDLQLIRDVQNDSKQIGGLLERHPEFNELATEIIEMWNKIIEKDLENRKAEK